MRKRFRMVTALLLAVVLILSLFTSLPVNASAVESKTEEVGASNPYNYYAKDDNGNWANCTWWAWQLAYDNTGVALPGWGNAGTWYNSAVNAGYNCDGTPSANSIAVRNSGGYGHVQFVTDVSGSSIYVKEGGYRGTSNGYHEGWDSTSGVIGYIHLAEKPDPDFTPADIGTGFYASIDNTKAAKPIIASGNNVVLGEMSGDQNQIWRFDRQNDTSYKIINAATGTCLDDENYGTANESNIQVCASNDSTAQRWYLKVVGNGYSLVPKCALQGCVDIHNGDLSAGSNVQLFQQNASDAQIFSISLRPSFNTVNKGESFTAAIIFNATGSAVTAFDNNNVGTKSYTGSTNQLWNFERMGNRSYKITNVATGKCLDDENYGTADKTNIQVCSSNGSYAQRWFLKPVSDGFSLAPQCALDSCIDSYDGGITDGQNIYLWTQNATAAQIVSLRYVIAPDYEVTFQGHEYKLYNKGLPWREAYKFCEQQGGHLVTINSEEEQTFIYNIIKNKSTRSYTWLGATDWYEEGNWKWITGSGIVYSNWADGEPNNYNDEDFMVLYNNSGKWNDGTDIYYSDTKAYSFICEIESDTLSCTLEKTFDYDSHRYEVYTNPVDWQTAKRFCEQKGGHLVTITSANENNTIKSNVKGLSNERYWLGLTDIDLQSNWKWITGESFSYKNWTSGEPNNNAGIESYAEFNTESGKWNDLLGFACVSLNIGFICEYDTIPKTEIQSDHVSVMDVVTTSDATSVSPSVTVKVDNKTLTKNNDYSVAVTSDIANGTGTVTVTGIGNYSGTVTKLFKIKINDTTVINDFLSQKYYTEKDDIITYYLKLNPPFSVNHLNGTIYYNQEVLEPIITPYARYHAPCFDNVSFQRIEQGQIRFDLYANEPVTLNNDIVVRMQFRVIKKGGESWLGNDFDDAQFAWDNLIQYGMEPHILTNQKLFSIGDTDLDGHITISDVTAIQRHIAELDIFSEEQLATADTNIDGKVDITDATYLQMYLAEFDDIVLGKQLTT